MTYHLLNTDNLIPYIHSILSDKHVFDASAELSVEEIGDGNMNFAFKVFNTLRPSECIFVKQAPPFIKVLGDDWPLTRERMTQEISTMVYHNQVCQGTVPKVIYLDQNMSVLITEFLDDHAILREHLIDKVLLPKFAQQISQFLANSLFYSSSFYLNPEEHAVLKKNNQNTDMCAITRDFVFTYAFGRHETNSYNPALSQTVIDSIQKDDVVRAKVAALKFKFANNAEALIHGDLHTGSIMANELSTYVIDPEFSFMGPMAFDTGALLANLYLSYFSHVGEEGSDEYADWLLKTISNVWQGFEQEFSKLWGRHETQKQDCFLGEDVSGESKGMYQSQFMNSLLIDTLGFAAVKMIRRILGVAKVADIMRFEDDEARAKIETKALIFAKKMLLQSEKVSTIDALNQLAKECA